MPVLGIDLHKRESQVAVLPDESTDEEPLEEVRVRNANLDEIATRYEGSQAVLEATSNYYAIYDRLSDYLEVTVANPLELSWIAESSRKTDEIDAAKLAELLRADMVPESYVPPEEIRSLRALTRGREHLVDERTKWKNEVHALLDQHGVEAPQELFHKSGREFLAELTLADPGDILLETYLETVDELTEKIDSLGEEIEARAAEIPEVQRLKTIPGVGSLTALQIYAEIGEIERFDRSPELVSYAGLDPSVRESADSRTEGSISKQGNKYLRTAVVQGAWRAVHNGQDPYLGKFYHRLREQKNKPEKVARVAAGRKLLVSIFHMLTREEEYNPPTG
ncbi:IS110 family transposase [Natrinema soli]|uniref:IS110 family transposase n=1 Tax=Natrinema soli TaxID=1930624 RepID=A0ABD5SMI6_9EURY|nr:IS110 family transposase [Natrinema soli]